MTWTRHFPIKDGWYWARYKRKGEEHKTIVRVWYSHTDGSLDIIATANIDPPLTKETVTHWIYIEEPGSPYAA